MYDILIVGAGPSGLAAGIAAKENGLHVKIIDEFPHAGGRLLGQLHEEPSGEWWNGIEETKKLLDQTETLNIEISLLVSVHHIEKLDDSFLTHTQSELIQSKTVIIATGAAESAAPIPGWTLPGVMSIGAAQVMTNVHRVKVGQKGVIVGVNVLSAAIARELQLAGTDIHSMALPVENIVSENESNPKKVMERLVRIAHLAPSAFIKFGSKFAKAEFVRNLALRFYPRGGIKMWGMPIHLRKAIKQINGTDKVESVTFVNVTPDGDIIDGTEETVEVDFVCIAGGLYPLAELAAVIGCPFQYLEELGGHVPVHNEQMKTPIEGLYVAGNITGIESSKVESAQGTLAGLSMTKEKADAPADLNKQVQRAMENVKQTRADASIQFHPSIDEGRTKVHDAFKQIEQEKIAR